MEAISNKNFLRIAREAALDEYREAVVYGALARVERRPERRAVLEELARQELRHYKFWIKFVDVRLPLWKFRMYAAFMVFLRVIFGVTFVAKLLERGEEAAAARYRYVLGLLEGEDKSALENIIRDEETHESSLIAQLDETIVKYMGALTLGLADAVIEITGAHAGALGATDSTVVAGVVGLVVGVGASISMATASYLQSKHEAGRSPKVAALVTGIGYMAAVSLMSLPYFLLHHMWLAFLSSVALGVFLAFILTFQGAVYTGRDFKSEFLQTAVLLLGTALLTYLLGSWLKVVFGIGEFT